MVFFPVITDHSPTKATAVRCTVMEEYLRDIVLTKVSSFVTVVDSGVAGYDINMNLSRLSIVQDNARVYHCPVVNNKLNEDDHPTKQRQQHQQRKPTKKCRWGSESPTKSSTIASLRSSVTKSSSATKKMSSRSRLSSLPSSSSSSSVCHRQDLTKSYMLPLGEIGTVKGALENAISKTSSSPSSSHSYFDPNQRHSPSRNRWSSSDIVLLNASARLSLTDSQRASSDQLVRAPRRRLSIEKGEKKLASYKDQDQQGLGELSQNFKWGSINSNTINTTATTRSNRSTRTSITPTLKTTTTANIFDEIVRRNNSK